MAIRKELFEMFLMTDDKYELYEMMVAYVEKEIHETKGRENADFYSVLLQLTNSINNAGWEKRRSEQIDLIRRVTGEIIDKYEEYLP